MSHPEKSIPTILDCDPGHDDMVAIMLAAAHPRIDLRAITTVAGNGTLEHTTYNARAVCSLAGIRDVPIAAGAPGPLVGSLHTAANVHGESALGGAELPRPDVEVTGEHAVDLIARLLRESAAPVTLVPTGPLTNIALLLQRHPDIAPRIREIVLMGGSADVGNVEPLAEFNTRRWRPRRSWIAWAASRRRWRTPSCGCSSSSVTATARSGACRRRRCTTLWPSPA